MPTIGVPGLGNEDFPAGVDRALVSPVVLTEDASVTLLSAWCTEAGLSDEEWKFIVHADNAGSPGALIHATASQSVAVAGQKDWVVNFNLSPGTYWIGIVGNSYQSRGSTDSGDSATYHLCMDKGGYSFDSPPSMWDAANDVEYDDYVICATLTYDVASSGINATLSKTLGNVLGTMTATSQVKGVVTKTLAGLTKTIKGRVMTKGVITKTLGALTLSSTAKTLTNTSVAATLAPLTVVATSKVDVKAQLAQTLDSMVASAMAGSGVNAELAATLDATTCVSTASVLLRSELDQVLEDLGINAVLAGSNVNAELIQTLEGVQSAASATVTSHADVDQTLGNVLGSVQSRVLIVGDLTKTLDDLQAYIHVGQVDPVAAEVDQGLGDLQGSIQASVPITGSLDQILDAVVMLATGDVVEAGLSVNQVLDDLVVSGQATVETHAVVLGDLGPLVSSVEGRILVEAELDRTLGQLTVQAFALVGDGPKLHVSIRVPSVVTSVKVPPTVSRIKI